ncbi:reverse transcriptase [Gossypium australe]|uniref:Reverse transcriptase n=1 Tax=Gossypium australe TaxID=47621 RepID=A0A5B6X4R6_9ROSI|nr:reverse transcriptase [Gossypium australe]
MEGIRKSCGYGNGIDVGALGSKGGLSLGWKDNYLVTLRSFSQYHIDMMRRDLCRGSRVFMGTQRNDIGACHGIYSEIWVKIRRFLGWL